MKVTVSCDRDETHLCSIAASRSAANAACQMGFGSARIPFHPSVFSSSHVLLFFLPFVAPNSTK
ncbi:hypothetical protein MPEAHAMD_7278 [Methylobacterium frigidaeris]|uniref:Uncharacterized protein n=1 Tax=Methylobacterium frigidaeris TaxID=2038277 RepID=A0AA37HKA1_9HYPH|nr:hypothetical protein MPEAHAMD_7278 [Methylobacterium frigidaeris]